MQPNDPQGPTQPGQDTGAVPQSQPTPVAAAVPAVDPAVQQSQAVPVEASPAQEAPLPVAEEEAEMLADDEELDDAPAIEPVSWVAHEYIHREKGTLWFTLFAIIFVGLGAISIFLMHSWTFAALLVVIAVVVVVYSRRPPRELNYSLTDDGLMIDNTLHKFSTFKSFGIIRDGEEFSVMLIPIQRFQPGISVYFPEESGEAIVDALGSRLPMKDLHLDVIDRIVRLLRL